MPDKKITTVFLGTPEFSIPVLHALVNSAYRPDVVLTQPDKPAGRKMALTPPPVKQFAKEYDLTVKQPENKKELTELIKKIKPDICILVAFGMIIPNELLTLPKYGWINIHPSLLPKYRGSSPIPTAIISGDNETGVSIIKLINKVDAGDILAQQHLEIAANDNTETLGVKLSDLAGRMLIDILPQYLDDKLKMSVQNDEQATYTAIIDRGNGLIDWHQSAIEIYRKFRGFYPWPGIFTYLGGKRLKIANLSVLEGVFDHNLATGTLFLSPTGELAVKCSQGAVLLDNVVLEGKKEVSGQDFIRGQKNIIGQILK